MAKLLVLWSTPSEEGDATLFTGFPDGHDPVDYRGQIEPWIRERTVAAPYFMMVFPDDVDIPQPWDSKGEPLCWDVVELV